MGNLEAKTNENYQKMDVKEYLGNVVIKQENLLNDRIMQETINIMKENIAKNYQISNLQTGVDKELIKLFDLNHNNPNKSENIPLDKLQEYIVRAYSENKLQRLLLNMSENFKIKPSQRYGIISNEESLYTFDISEQHYSRVHTIGEFSTLLIVSMFECLIITEKDTGYHLIAKQQEHKKLYQEIIDFGQINERLCQMLKTDNNDLQQNMTINLIITFMQINLEYQTLLTNNSALFVALVELMFDKLGFFEDYLNGKEEHPYLVRMQLSKDDYANNILDDSYHSQQSDQQHSQNPSQPKEQSVHNKEQEEQKKYNNAKQQTMFDPEQDMLNLNENILLKTQNIIIIFLAMSQTSKQTFLSNPDYFSRLQDITFKLDMNFPMEVKIIQNYLQIIVTLVDAQTYQFPKLYQETVQQVKELDVKYFVAELKKKGFTRSKQIDQFILERVSKAGVDFLAIKDHLSMLHKQITLIQISL